MIRFLHITLVLIFLQNTCIALSNDSTQTPNYRNRKIIVASTSAGIAGGSLVYLSKAWYLQYNNGSFNFFNDNDEWQQMDKLGHFWTTYNSARLMHDAFEWAGNSKMKSIIYGGLVGFTYMACIEMMDGYSIGWGFSYGDMIANTAGTGFAMGQTALWNEQRLFFKFSYVESGLARYNPNLLGKDAVERVLKDYNGQVYWLSFSPFTFIGKDSKFPKWLNVSLGYGATGMVRAKESFISYNHPGTPNVTYYFETERYRNFYLSLDIDLTRIRTRSKTLKAVFNCLNILKIPAPALQLNKHGASFLYLR